MRLPDDALRAFKVRILPAFIAVLQRQLKYIYLYELFWQVFATFIWRNQFGGAYPVFYEDNESAQFSLLRRFFEQSGAIIILGVLLGGFGGTVHPPSDRPRRTG